MEDLKTVDDDFIKNIALFMLKHNMQEECKKISFSSENPL